MPLFASFNSIYTEPISDALPEFSLTLHEQNPNSIHDKLTNYRPYEMQAGIGISANARGKTTGTIAALQIDTGSGNDPIVHHVGGTTGPGGTSYMTENLDSRLINHDDFLLVNNGGSTESVNGTIGYEMQVGMGISANARGKTTGTIAALQKEDIHCTGHCFDGGSTENLGTTSGPGGTSFLTGYAEAVGLDSSTVDVVTCPPCGASLGGDFI